MTLNDIKTKAKYVVQKARSLLPETLPQGQTEFDAWLDSIQSLYILPTQERSDLIQVFASIIINLGPLQDKKSKYYFVKSIRTAAAKQVAGNRFYELQMAKKAKQAEEARAAQAKSVEATTTLKVVANEPTSG